MQGGISASPRGSSQFCKPLVFSADTLADYEIRPHRFGFKPGDCDVYKLLPAHHQRTATRRGFGVMNARVLSLPRPVVKDYACSFSLLQDDAVALAGTFIFLLSVVMDVHGKPRIQLA